MLRNGYTSAFAEQIFEQIKGFGSYGFPESHGHSSQNARYIPIVKEHAAGFSAGRVSDLCVRNCHSELVGLGGLEPPASPLSGVRSNHLSYRPKSEAR